MGLNTKLQDALGTVLQQLTGALEQHTEVYLRMRRTDVLNNALTPTHILRDLHPGRAQAVRTLLMNGTR